MHCNLKETGGTTGRARTTSTSFNPWAAGYDTWLLIKLTPKGVVFSFSAAIIANGLNAGGKAAFAEALPSESEDEDEAATPLAATPPSLAP